jgi:hypothetical protein
MNVSNTKVLAAWFGKSRGAYLDVILAGRVFGGRHGESPQQPRDYAYEGQTLRVWFAGTELLTVAEPTDFVLGKDGQLIVPRARTATFGWHYYGRPQTPENWCEEVYELSGDKVLMKRTGPLLPTEEEFPLQGERLVELS